MNTCTHPHQSFSMGYLLIKMNTPQIVARTVYEKGWKAK